MRKSSFVGLLIASLATTVVSIFAIMAWIIKNDNVNTLPFMGTITDSKNIEIEEYTIFNDNYLRVAKPANISNFYIKNGNSYETATSYSDETTYYFKTSKGKYQTCYLEYETVEYYNNMEDLFKRVYSFEEGLEYYRLNLDYTFERDLLVNSTTIYDNPYFVKSNERSINGLLLEESIFYKVKIKSLDDTKKLLSLDPQNINGGESLKKIITQREYNKLDDKSGYVEFIGDDSQTYYSKEYTYLNDNGVQRFNMCDLYKTSLFEVDSKLTGNEFKNIRQGDYNQTVNSHNVFNNYSWQANKDDTIEIVVRIMFSTNTTDEIKNTVIDQNSYSKKNITFGNVWIGGGDK